MNNQFFDFDLFVVPTRKQNTKIHHGNGEKGIFIIYESKEEEVDLTNFLAKVLQAAKIDINKDIFLVSLKPDELLDFSAFCHERQIKHVLSFGIAPKRLGLHLNHQLYMPFLFNQRTFLFVDSLPAIFEERQEGGKRMSGALWKALKEVFLS